MMIIVPKVYVCESVCVWKTAHKTCNQSRDQLNKAMKSRPHN